MFWGSILTTFIISTTLIIDFIKRKKIDIIFILSAIVIVLNSCLSLYLFSKGASQDSVNTLSKKTEDVNCTLLTVKEDIKEVDYIVSKIDDEVDNSNKMLKDIQLHLLYTTQLKEVRPTNNQEAQTLDIKKETAILVDSLFDATGYNFEEIKGLMDKKMYLAAIDLAHKSLEKGLDLSFYYMFIGDSYALLYKEFEIPKSLLTPTEKVSLNNLNFPDSINKYTDIAIKKSRARKNFDTYTRAAYRKSCGYLANKKPNEALQLIKSSIAIAPTSRYEWEYEREALQLRLKTALEIYLDNYNEACSTYKKYQKIKKSLPSTSIVRNSNLEDLLNAAGASYRYSHFKTMI